MLKLKSTTPIALYVKRKRFRYSILAKNPMKMKAQNLILKCNASQMPKDNEFREFVFQQLDNPNVDYGGNPATDHKNGKTDSLLLNFHFKTPYEVDEETAIEMITWAFYKKQIEKIKTGKREIEIFLS